MAGRRWSAVTRTLWTDARFLGLSSPEPNAQTLWIYLLTCPFQVPVPGLLPVGVGALADGLGWSPTDLSKCLGELVRAGLVETSTRPALVWIPKAVFHNPPDNPNQIKGWRSTVDEMPECALLDRAIFGLREGIKETLHPTFDKVFGNRLANPSANPLPNQDQDQDQEQENAPARQKASPPADLPNVDKNEARKSSALLAQKLLEAIATHSLEHARYRVKPSHLRLWVADIDKLIRLDGANEEEIAAVIRWAHVEDKSEFWRPNLLSGRGLRRHFPRLRLQAEKAGMFKAVGQSQSKELWLEEHADWLIRNAQLNQTSGGKWNADVLCLIAKAEGVPVPAKSFAGELAAWAFSRI